MELKANLVDIHNNKTYPASIKVLDGIITQIQRINEKVDNYILPGFVDAHVHIESSMVTPVEFSRTAITHGTIGAVSDPHEIANVLGKEGVTFMLENAKNTPMKIVFGAPSCVPATNFESSGAEINVKDIEELLKMDGVEYLSEMMNFPGVIHGIPEVMEKVTLAHQMNVPIDGHAPGLAGEELEKYAQAGITTDHECFSIEEAEEKIGLGMKILIREGSGAKNFDALIPLLERFPDKIMFCTDDLHPDDLLKGHINLLVKRAIEMGFNLYDVIRAGGYNAALHYGMDIGTLQVNDPADFLLVDSLEEWNILKTFINGKEVYSEGVVKIGSINTMISNKFGIYNIKQEEIKVIAKASKLRVIEAINGELVTKSKIVPTKIVQGLAVQDTEFDLLKIAVVNRYKQARPGIGFIHGFNLKKGAIASSIGHDSHNIICVGVGDLEMTETINWIIDNKGGIAVHNGTEIEGLQLEIAGIMSSGSVLNAARKYHQLTLKAKEIGTTLDAPFMTLAFMALLVIPELKLSDKGLFDGNSFSFTPLFVE